MAFRVRPGWESSLSHLLYVSPWAGYIKLSEPLFSQLQNGYNKRTYIIRLMWELINIIFKALAQCLAYKCSVNINKKLKFMTVFDI